MIIRESIYAALYKLGSGAANFTTTSRRLRHWSDVNAGEMPALFMSEKGGTGVLKAHGAPVVWTLHADFFIYVCTSDPYIAPAQLLNPLVDAVENALGPSP